MKKTKTKKQTPPTTEELRNIANNILAENDDFYACALAEDWLRLNPAPKELPESLTERQRDVVNFFKDEWQRNQTIPTIREMCAQFHIRSPNGVICHLKALEKKGVMYKLDTSTARCWRIVDGY